MATATQETTQQDSGLNGEPSFIAGLLPALQRLDRLLELAVAHAEAAYGEEAGADPYRGLHISPEEVARLLQHRPGEPLLYVDGHKPEEGLPGLRADSRLAWLELAYDLSAFDMDLLLLALAPELDRRYERLYAYLQDHVARRRPTVDLALHLLCADAAERLQRRRHFDPQAPLLHHGLIQLLPEPGYDHPTLLAKTIKLDEQVLRFILQQDGLDERLTPFCCLADAFDFLEDLPLAAEVRTALTRLARDGRGAALPLVLYFQGPEGAGKRQAAAALAAEQGTSLLVVDVGQMLAAALPLGEALRLVQRYAWFYGVIPYFDGVDRLRDESRALALGEFLDALAAGSGLAILAGGQPWPPSPRQPLGVVTLAFTPLDCEQRRACWQAALAHHNIAATTDALDAVSQRFQLWPGQIAEAAATVANQIILDPSPGHPVTQSPYQEDLLLAAARGQTGHDLARLTHRITPVYTWDDIVLPADALAQLHEICQRVTHRHRVLEEWGFGARLSTGKGVNALFSGPSGTGKTMAAEIIAYALGLDLYKIDLSGVVSKYIGETEKNLDRIFTAAEQANAILFFDEADALFGKRSEVRDSHDRYANIEISYLLQKMETYEGLAILATNLQRNLDESFIRRLAFTVHFPFPDEASRLSIWQGVWPHDTPKARGLDLAFLARQFKLSGGNIRNIALAAAFAAAQIPGPVGMAHLMHALRREYQKLGKTLSPAELAAQAEEVAA